MTFLKIISLAKRNHGIYLKENGRMYWVPQQSFGAVFPGIRYLHQSITVPKVKPIFNYDNENDQWLAERCALINSQALNGYAPCIDRHHIASVYIKFIHPDIRYGVFARRFIPKRSFIGVYTGEIKFRHQLESKCYAFKYMPDYRFESEDLILDAYSAGNETRFINDSPFPNLDQVTVSYNGRWYLILIANQDIYRDDQLLYDYGEGFFRSTGIKRIIM